MLISPATSSQGADSSVDAGAHPTRNSHRSVSSRSGWRRSLSDRRGSTLAAALALTFLIFAITAISLARVASVFGEASFRHNQASALFIAEAGIRQAAHKLTTDSNYRGEKGARVSTGYFDVSVADNRGAYQVASTGYVDSPLKLHPRKTVRARVSINGHTYMISDWREGR